jgi:hypothetical protein
MIERKNGFTARKLVAVGASLAVLGGGLLVSSSADAQRGKASTKVTIQGGGSISGYVKSPAENRCANGRKVIIYRLKNDHEEKIGTDIATPNGDKYQWSGGNPGNGKFFAAVKETSKCEGDLSRVVRN